MAKAVPAGAVTLASVLRANGYRTGAFIGSVILDRANGLDQGFDIYDSPFRGGSVRRDASLVTRAARQWLEKNKGQPVFAFIHLYDLHTPYTLPQVAGLRPDAAGYDAELQYIDQTLGRFRDALMKGRLVGSGPDRCAGRSRGKPGRSRRDQPWIFRLREHHARAVDFSLAGGFGKVSRADRTTGGAD